jgi:hypothetical protein
MFNVECLVLKEFAQNLTINFEDLLNRELWTVNFSTFILKIH